MSSILQKASTAIHRTKQAVLVKVGKADETVDIEYSQEKERFLAHFKAVKDFKKSMKKLNKAAEHVSKSQVTLCEGLVQMFDTASDYYSVATKAEEAARQITDAGNAFASEITADAIDPMRKYHQQFREVEKRIATRSTRKADMDRYRYELVQFQKNAKDKRTAAAEEKFENAKAKYDAINGELSREIPLLIQDRVSFYEPIFATYLHALSEYYAIGDSIMGSIVHLVGSVDRMSAHSHQRVITPKDNSAAFQTFNAISSPPSTHDSYSEHSSPHQSAVPPAMSNAPAAYGNQGGYGGSQARALYDFNTQEPDELPFRVGDVLTIHSMDGEWWQGELRGRRGVLPSNYVQLL